jgi:NADH-quinone oxidoreductase subunit L
MLPFLLILPLLLGVALIAFLPSTSLPRYIALAAAIASLFMLFLIHYGAYNIGWFNIGGASVGFSASITPVSLLLLAIVLLIAPAIFFYSFGYMKKPSEQRRYYIEMLIFESAMLVFAMSGNYITLFVAWEFLSFMSYMLIGFYKEKASAARSARKAISTVLIGDIAIIAAIAIIWTATGSFSIGSIPSNPTYLLASALLLCVAILTKSAQFPFQEWLPDAMEGPTPVSAFLHSSTMVKAGVFAFIILYPLFSAAHILYLFMILSAITVVISTLGAAKEMQIKRVIAYSTTQELGLMIFAASIGSITAALYFFLVQSFYKSLLFFSSGTVMEATGEDSLDKTTGLKENRLIYITTIIGVLSLAGFLPFSGFFGNIGISSSANSLVVYAFLSIIGFSTSFFIIRWVMLASKKADSQKTKLAYKKMPKSMVISMIFLALLALLSSIAFFYIGGFLRGDTYFLEGYVSLLGIKLYDVVIETVLAFLGLFASYYAFSHKKSISGWFAHIIHNSDIFNALYIYFADALLAIASGVAIFDRFLSVGFEDIGNGISISGRGLRRFAVGDINAYVFVLIAAIAAALWYAYALGVIK